MKYIIACVVSLAVLLGACDGDDTASDRATPITTQKAAASTFPPSTTEAGSAQVAAAVWVIRDPQPVSTDSTQFTADVVGLDCNEGVTGRVLPPTIREDAAQITVTFTVVAPIPGAHTCPGNKAVPTVVTLTGPIGQRKLVDGACDPGGAAVSTAFCKDEYANPVRWSP
jgi:hypothetical protein